MQHEFIILSKRLLGIKHVPNELCLRYEKAIALYDITLSRYEQKVWRRMLQYPLFFRLYDSGFALVRPNAVLRRKTFTALAILECTPQYASYFLSTKVSLWEFVKLSIGLPLAVAYGIIGGVFVYFKI